MNPQLKERIARKLEALSDERGYQVLDYVEFLGSRYAVRQSGGNLLQSLAEGVEDTMRAARLPIKAIVGTTTLIDSAGKVMKGVAAAAASVVDEAVQAVSGKSEPIEGAPGRSDS